MINNINLSLKQVEVYVDKRTDIYISIPEFKQLRDIGNIKITDLHLIEDLKNGNKVNVVSGNLQFEVYPDDVKTKDGDVYFKANYQPFKDYFYTILNKGYYDSYPYSELLSYFTLDTISLFSTYNDESILGDLIKYVGEYKDYNIYISNKYKGGYNLKELNNYKSSYCIEKDKLVIQPKNIKFLFDNFQDGSATIDGVTFMMGTIDLSLIEHNIYNYIVNKSNNYIKQVVSKINQLKTTKEYLINSYNEDNKLNKESMQKINNNSNYLLVDARFDRKIKG